MKFSLERVCKLLIAGSGATLLFAAAIWTATARGALPAWLRNVESRSELESAFFRLMKLPGAEVLFRRPPSETRPALSELIKKQPSSADLYALRALEDEQQLDFAAAETDWKASAELAVDKPAAQLALADFYHRRVRPLDEISALSAVAAGQAIASEKYAPPQSQRPWGAFERIFKIIQSQALPADVSSAQYRAWISRYPQEQVLNARYLEFLLQTRQFPAASALVAQYRKQFPQDEVFPVKAEARIQYVQGSVEQGLAVYQKRFQPLWDPELVKSYFDLLGQTHNLRKFLDEARSAEAANVDDLGAVSRVFYYYQQQGKLDLAQEAIARFRQRKDGGKSPWTSQQLFTCAKLLEDIHAYPEAARFYYALYNSKGREDARELAITGLARVLFTAPEAPIRLGSGEISLYRDVATMDQGPGYLNGILSLLFNSESPAAEYSAEEQRAVPYFHRAKAAELVRLLDTQFPNSSARSALHASLIDFYSTAGESEAVIASGKEFLAAFPNAPQRTKVSLQMADAYSRTGQTAKEFAIYDAVLQELAVQASQMPLGEAASGSGNISRYVSYSSETNDDNSATDYDTEDGTRADAFQTRDARTNSAFRVPVRAVQARQAVRSPQYSRVLERYLARLVELKLVPQALAVLRRELDHNPDDPGLYERLAVFLDQNRLGAEQEAVYRRAMARFPDRSWYHKLARFYLRQQRNAEFQRLTEEAVKTFAGSDLETYFHDLVGGSPALYLHLNQYAHARFPHNPVFVRNLLRAYSTSQTWNPTAWEVLLREHWFEESDLRAAFFEFLSRTGKLDAELKALQLQPSGPGEQQAWNTLAQQNPAAAQFAGQVRLWQSHFEESAPVLGALAASYPADVEVGRAVSSVFRSLAYFDPSATSTAVKIEENLLAASPGSAENLARIGDIYADRQLYAKASPYWERISKIAPGESGGYLAAATIYWDYYDFDSALRLLQEGREKLEDESLYSYETGAIYEGKRDYRHAIEEYTRGALAAGAGSPAENRLLELAYRPKYKELIDKQTQQRVSSSKYSSPAVALRVRILEAQSRNSELAPLLDEAIGNAGTIEQAAEWETLAQQKSLEAVRLHAVEKQAALAADPVTRLHLRYTLVGLYEARKDRNSAQRLVEVLYRENPKILGVVRATVDFYWHTKQFPQALTILREAAQNSYPELSRQFIFEAARKSTEVHQYAEARALLVGLMKNSPYDAQYLAAVADTYAQAGDQQGLKQFYIEQISAFRSAPLPVEERKARVAALRRGLIPALTKLQDYAGAIDQYVEIINAFPEDEALASEAALYAQRHAREQQLAGYYARTVENSPRDYRWAMVLARIYAGIEKFPPAIDAYGRSISIRPDRTDLRIARAALNERLMHFDDAAVDYEKLYQLAYKDPAWMEKLAELRARQGRTAECIAALKTALLDPAPPRPANYFAVARRLESWGLLTPAREFAEQGINAAGADVLAVSENHSGAQLYARIMTHLRQQDRAWQTLQRAVADAASSGPVLKEQVAKQGIAAITDAQWRQRVRDVRIETARVGMATASREIGSAVARYFTPEEKSAFVSMAKNWRLPLTFADADAYAVPLAQSAGFGELEAAWRFQSLMESPLSPGMFFGEMNAYLELQRKRLQFAEAAAALERFAPRLPATQQQIPLLAAAESYRSAADPENELRILSRVSPNWMSRENRERYLSLLLQRQPQQLVAVASIWNSWGDDAAKYAVNNGDPSLVSQIISARGRQRPPVWAKTNVALFGMYFSQSTPEVDAAFQSALGDNAIAAQIAKHDARDVQLAGDIWFYYASRYGEYLAAMKQRTPDDYLPAELEHSPAASAGYVALADYYAETGDQAAAVADYQHALEIAPGAIEVHDRIAVTFLRQGSRASAISEWKLFFAALARQADRNSPSENFWADFARGCDHIRSRKLFAEMQPSIDAALRAYLRRNGNYRSNAPLRAAYLAAANPPSATAWIIDLASAATNSTDVLADIADAAWIPLPERERIYERVIDSKRKAFDAAQGLEREAAEENLIGWQIRQIKYLLEASNSVKAAELLAAFPPEVQKSRASVLVPLQLRVDALRSALDSRIAAYGIDPQSAPSGDVLRATARQIQDAGDRKSARIILEYLFNREIEDRVLTAPNFLGLAEIRIENGDLSGAVSLLRRMVLVAGDAYANMDSAAQLLQKTGHSRESLEFLEPLAKSTPWESAYQLRLANATIASAGDVAASQQRLANLSRDFALPYATRVQAAISFSHEKFEGDPGSEELALLAARTVGTNAADRPFFYDARLRSAASSSDAVTKVRLLQRALSEAPARDDARLPLFYAAASMHSDELALASVRPLLQGRNLSIASPDEADTAEAGDSYSSTDADVDHQEAPHESKLAAQIPAVDRARLLATAADVLLRLERLDEALRYFQDSRRLEKGAAQQKQTDAKIRAVREQLRRRRVNAARQPILHEALEQDRVVRPRLVARLEPPASAVSRKGATP